MHFDKEFFKLAIPEVEFLSLDVPKDWSITADSRQAKKGDIFVALKGTRHDGHDFLTEAINKDISGLIIDKSKKDILNKISPDILKKLFVAIVPNTKEALISLATHWRSLFDYPVIGITGSVGKTSTKEILNNILELANVPFISSVIYEDSPVSVSLNILRMRSYHKVAIIEMGISKRGQMSLLADIVRPTSACITSIGHSHMEGLGSIFDIANEKKDIFKHFKESNIGIVNGDQPILANISYNHPIIRFGSKTTNQVQARKIQANNLSTNFVLKLYKNRYKITLDTNHPGRVTNVLAATAISYLLNINSEFIVKGIQMPLVINSRFQQANLKYSKGLLIDDCYNATPESVKAALLAFEKFESKGQKIAVLGDMLELGVNSSFWHRQLGRFLRKAPSLNHVVLVGDLVGFARNTVPVGLSFEHVKNWQEAVNHIKSKLDREAVILVKGSRSVELNNLVNELKE